MKANNDIESRKQRMYLFIQKEFNLYKRKYTQEPYFNHLVAVAKNCTFHNIKYGFEIGLCHDLFEDTAMLPHQFIEIIVGFGYGKKEAEIISNVVLELTNKYTTIDYPELNRKERSEFESDRLANVSELAQNVKCCDIMDNCKDIVNKDHEFATHYLVEKESAVKKMKNINEFIQLRVDDILFKSSLELEGKKLNPNTKLLANRWNQKLPSKNKT